MRATHAARRAEFRMTLLRSLALRPPLSEANRASFLLAAARSSAAEAVMCLQTARLESIRIHAARGSEFKMSLQIRSTAKKSSACHSRYLEVLRTRSPGRFNGRSLGVETQDDHFAECRASCDVHVAYCARRIFSRAHLRAVPPSSQCLSIRNLYGGGFTTSNVAIDRIHCHPSAACDTSQGSASFEARAMV